MMNAMNAMRRIAPVVSCGTFQNNCSEELSSTPPLPRPAPPPRRPGRALRLPPPSPSPTSLLPPAVAGVLRRPLAGRPRWRRTSGLSPPGLGWRGAALAQVVLLGGDGPARRRVFPGAARVAKVVVALPLVAGRRWWSSGPAGPDLGPLGPIWVRAGLPRCLRLAC